MKEVLIMMNFGIRQIWAEFDRSEFNSQHLYLRAMQMLGKLLQTPWF